MDLEFADAMSTPLNVPEGGVVSVGLANNGPTEVVIRSLRLIADPGLEASYIGYSATCNGACGAQNWDAATSERVLNARDGVLPIVEKPWAATSIPGGGYRERPQLIIRMRLRDGDSAAAAALEQGCLKVHAAELTLTTGKKVVVGFPGFDFIAGITTPNPSPSYRKCAP